MSDNEQRETTDESIMETMRDSGVGTEDPNIVGDPEPGLVDEEIGDEDDQPEV